MSTQTVVGVGAVDLIEDEARGIPSGQPGDAADAADRRRPGWRARIARVRPSVVLSWFVVLIVVAWAIAPGLFTGYDPIAGDAAAALQAPSALHPFGTDATGRDMFSRVVHGAIHSLSGALVAVTVGLVAGTLLGVVAGTVGGFVDDVIMRIVDVLLAIPGLLLALSFIIILGFGTVQAAIAVGIGAIASFARLTRSEVLRVRSTDYVEAAFGSGGRFWPVLLRHVLPNSLTPVLALAALNFGGAILAISALGFLGFGAPPPTPEWGLMIAEGRNYIATAWWLTTLPGLVVIVVVLSANRLSAVAAERGRR
ncbi:ABC transporter permease [Microbacterium sp. Sa4CUA7]|uniref:ABC transporter permease n=1 Tax=Microbacterium pullorum TaxID=2762236 RepID=A0ABR8S5L1_9MICO|nr:ABC transporter permease [Microbacterium pullorum]MBD7958776.1 ABC transporter permease [Microbacterium pullorum]